MNNPDSYVKYQKLQYRDNMQCLTENIGRFKWKIKNGQDEKKTKGLDALDTSKDSNLATIQNEPDLSLDESKPIRVLDVGCADGRFTSTELRRVLPPNCEIIGCDKSPAMVDYANNYHGGKGVKFELVEIGKPLPDHFIGAFDHIFSFFSYHWMPNQKIAFSQTYDMLTSGGDCLLLMVTNSPYLYDVYRWFSRSKRWSIWVNNVEDAISPYHDCEDPQTKVKKIAEEAGFKDIYVKATKLTYTYASEQDFKLMLTSLNPFALPEELMEEYLEEFVRVAKNEGYISDTLTIEYSTITIYARKS